MPPSDAQNGTTVWKNGQHNSFLNFLETDPIKEDNLVFQKNPQPKKL